MKIIYKDSRIIGTATDAYSGPDSFLDTPPDYDSTFMYTIVDGALIRQFPNVSPRQIRQALSIANLRSSVEAAVGAGDQNTKDWWDFATEFERNHPKVVAMGEGLNVSTSQLDDLWSLAYSL